MTNKWGSNGIFTDSHSRNEYLDVVKYFTIFCVLWGHVVQQTCMLKNPNVDYIYRAIYTFHMPLFMGMCGYFFAKSVMKWGWQDYIKYKLKSRLLGLIIPMLSFGVLKIIIDHQFSLTGYIKAVKGIWFLGDLAINTVLILLILRWCNYDFWHDVKYFILPVPFTIIPYVGYGSQGLFMYAFFALGYGLAVYYKHGFTELIKYWKYILSVFIVSFILFDIMPYEPTGWVISIKDPVKMLVVSGLKFVMAVTGCYLSLIFIYKIMPVFKNTVLEKRAIEQGRYTLDIYLLNIIILEMISGKLYRNMVKLYDYNFLHVHGLIVEIISTFIGACLMMEIIIFIRSIMNGNKYLAKIFFYRNQ